MKASIVICTVALSMVVFGCSSENKQEKMWDTSVAADSDFINLDTGATDSTPIDTAVKDTSKTNYSQKP